MAAPLSRPAAAVERPRPKGDLAAEGLSFAYAPDAPPVIDGVTARFPAGTAIGLIGENGAGKSTLLKLLMGRYGPDRGRVTLDGADLAQFGDRELSRWFGYLPQEPFLFAGSVRDNIVGGREGVADAEILSAARLAGAEAFISALPDGFGAPVGEGGGRLPPGHRQRIALARALAADPAVLVLDEPSANLDRQAELALAERLAALKSGRSLVLVSHSETLLGACDLVMALSGGRIAMAGPAAEMIARRDATPAASRARPQRPPLSAEGAR